MSEMWIRVGAAGVGAAGAAAALLAVLLCSTRFEERPEVFSFAFLAMQVHWLAALGPDAAPGRRDVLRFALVEALWANVHGYFAFGPVPVQVQLLVKLAQAPRPALGSSAIMLSPAPPAAQPVAPVPPAAPAATGAPVPVTPHRRGSPNPLKVKVGKKGASAGK